MNECRGEATRTARLLLEQSPGIHEKISRSFYRNGKDLGNALGRQRHELSYQPNAAGRQLSGEDRPDPVYLTHVRLPGPTGGVGGVTMTGPTSTFCSAVSPSDSAITVYSPSRAVKENCPSASLRVLCSEPGPGELFRRSLTVAASTPSPPRETVPETTLRLTPTESTSGSGTSAATSQKVRAKLPPGQPSPLGRSKPARTRGFAVVSPSRKTRAPSGPSAQRWPPRTRSTQRRRSTIGCAPGGTTSLANTRCSQRRAVVLGCQ